MAGKATAFHLDEGRVMFREKTLEAERTEREPAHPRKSEGESSFHEGDVIKKVNAHFSPRGKHGQKYLVFGDSLSLRLWEDEQPGQAKAKTQREYETVGYVIAGRAELHFAKQKVLLEPGDSWLVPKGVSHQYRILEPFTAIEATCPPARPQGRDDG